MGFDRLVCDEAHRLSNRKTINYETISRIHTRSSWFLTATPIVNSINDINSLFSLLMVEYDDIYKLAAVYILSRTMDQLPDAPLAPINITHELGFTCNEEAEFYRGIQSKIVNQIMYGEVNGLDKLALLLRLRQLSIHPNVYIQMKRKNNIHMKLYEGTSAKFEMIVQLLNAECNAPHKWILFCHFHEEMIMLKDLLSTIDFIRHIGIYSGKLSGEERNALLKTLKQPLNDDKTADVLIIQLQSGGVGLNLQEFDRIIFSGPWWTQSMMNQAIGRAVRIGQQNQVYVHHLHLNEEKSMNIDRIMNAKAKAKGELNERILMLANRNLASN